MKTLEQLAIILGLSYLGHILAAGLSVPLPASVVGIVLLLAALRAGWLPESRIDGAARFLTANMAFFFLPSAVEIIGNIEIVRPVLFRLIFVCVAATAATFVVTYHAARVLQKLTGGKDERP